MKSCWVWTLGLLCIARSAQAELPLWIDSATVVVGGSVPVALRFPASAPSALSIEVEVWSAPAGVAVETVTMAPQYASCAAAGTTESGTTRVAVACMTPRPVAGPVAWLRVRGRERGRSVLSVHRCRVETLSSAGVEAELGCVGYGGLITVR